MPQVHKKLQTKISNFRPSKIVSGVANADSSANRAELFRSARFNLTGFYLIILIVFSLFLTLSLRTLASHAFDQAGLGERSAVRQLLNNYFSVPLQPDKFNRYQSNQSANIHRDLDIDVVIINAIAIIAGGMVSYWYAGRTLRPIEKAHAAQARFAADASHELRTPLTTLRVENEVFLRQKSIKKGEAEELIKSNLEEVQRLENLAGNLLALSQYEDVQLKLEPTELTAVATKTLELAEIAAKNKQVHFNINIPYDAIVMADFNSLVQLLGILVDNAIKYGPRKSEIFIDAIAGDDGSYFLSVRDEGEGIAEADLPYIFDRMYRGDKSRTSRTPGYGLGLSLAREIVRANHATITARNYPSGGAQFVISLKSTKK